MIRLSVACLLLGAWGWAHAQYMNSMTGRSFNNIYAANADRLMSNMIQQAGYAAMRGSIEASAKGKRMEAVAAPGPAKSTPAPNAAPRLPLTATDFAPAGPRRVPEALASEAKDAKDRQQLVAAGREIQKAIEATPGFRRNNVAAAMTVLVGVSLQVTKGVALGDDESLVLMQGLNEHLAATPSFKLMSAADKTQMYDAFVVIGGFIAGIAQEGAERKDAALQQQARAMAADALAKFGVRLN